MPEVGYHKYVAIKKWRYQIFWPLALVLKKIGITANQLSLLGFLLIGGFMFYVVKNPLLACLFLFLHILIDGLDGALAKARGEDNASGELVDTVADYSSLFLVVLMLGYAGLADPGLGLAYIYLYIVMMIFTIARYLLKIPSRLVIRSKMVLYAAYVCWAFTGANYLNYVLFIFSLSMLPLVLIDFLKIKQKISKDKFKLKDY